MCIDSLYISNWSEECSAGEYSYALLYSEGVSTSDKSVSLKKIIMNEREFILICWKFTKLAGFRCSLHSYSFHMQHLIAVESTSNLKMNGIMAEEKNVSQIIMSVLISECGTRLSCKQFVVWKLYLLKNFKWIPFSSRNRAINCMSFVVIALTAIPWWYQTEKKEVILNCIYILRIRSTTRTVPNTSPSRSQVK